MHNSKLEISVFLAFFLSFMIGGCREENEELERGIDTAASATGKTGGGIKNRSRKRGKNRNRKKKRRTRRGRPPQALVLPDSWGTVVHVVDGDTVYLKMEDEKKTFVKARLVGIDAPECHKKRTRIAGGRRSAHCVSDDDFFGLESYRLMKKFVMGKRVRVRCETEDTGFCKCGFYGRPLLAIELDGKDVGEILLERGGGWAYTKYTAPNMAGYCMAEDRGRKMKRGMWKYGTREQVMAKMCDETRRWYKRRDKTCRRLIRKLKESRKK